MLLYQSDRNGEMSEWSMVTVLKTVVRKHRGFESLSLRHFLFGKGVSIGLRSRWIFLAAKDFKIFRLGEVPKRPKGLPC